MQDKKGLLALILNGIILGTYGVWTILLQKALTGYQQVALRGIISFILAVPIVFILKSKLSFARKYNKNLILYLISFALSSILFTVSVLQSSIALGVFGLYIGSILTAFALGCLFFKEKITRVKIFSVIFVFIALILLTLPFSKNLLSIGLIIGIGSGIFDGIGNAFKKYFFGKIERPTLIMFQIFATLVISLSFALLAREAIKFPQPMSFAFLGITIYGIIYLSVAYLSMYGFQHFDLNLGTIIISSEIFWAALFAFLIFHQTLTIYQMLGGCLIFLAIILPYIKFTKLFSLLLLRDL